MNILAIDYGKKRLGLAWFNSDVGVVLPYGVLENKTAEKNFAELIKLITEEKPNKIVLGLPLGLNGEENSNSLAVRDFGSELGGNTGLEIIYFDERFTSLEADKMGGSSSRDEKAAMIILQSYVDKNKTKK